jgi:hypothetical protein
VHGVIIASNEHLESALDAGSYYEINSTIHEMLAPFVVSPTAKYTFTSGTASIDQNDMRRTIWNEVSADEKWPGLCTIGMAERPLRDFEFDEQGAAVNYEPLLEELIERANDLTTCEWQTRHGKSRYVAFLIAPGKVFGRRPFGFVRTVQNKILMESELRLDSSSRVSPGGRSGGMGRQERNAMLGYTSLLTLDNAATVKVVILYANVRVRAVDELFEEALGRELTNGQDGWDEIGQLTQAQVDELEIEQLSNDMTRESAQSLVNENFIGRPYPFQR